MDLYRYELPNGIRCVHRRTKTAVAYCALTVDAGSRDELPAEHGIAHFIEHLLFKGTERRRAWQINSRLENLGGELNAFTTKEETVVHAATLRGDFAKAAELIADVVFHSTFPAREIDREKEVVLDEINSYKDTPVERIYDEFEDRIFAGTSLGHNILGDKKTLARFTAQELRNFRERTYNTDRMVFSSAGPCGERRFREICERFFGPVSRNERAFQRTFVSETPPFRQEYKRNTFQAHCLLGGQAYSNRSPRRTAFSLLVNLLGGSASNSLLNMALRERNGFSYNIEAGYTPFSDTGLATIYFGTDRDKLEPCLDLIDREIRRLIAGKVSPRRFSIARKQFIGQLLISLESHENNMLNAGKSLLVYNRIEPPPETIRRIESLSLSELIETAQQIYGQPLSMLTYK